VHYEVRIPVSPPYSLNCRETLQFSSENRRKSPQFRTFRAQTGLGESVILAVLILAAIARKLRLVSVAKSPVLPVSNLTLRPKDPIHMRVEARY